ncbi:hypothetical protein RRG08_009213 [Elysia crispata]|uniref:Uncharacterized protein n=1 Tax=Elysia crispata TaxID=231223 RepID=A0AAE1D155_9GAST|nr:hypothetical protein RRG08_009213 [Elysia crispata]
MIKDQFIEKCKSQNLRTRPGSTYVADPLSRLLPTVSLPSYDNAEGHICKLETTSLPVAYPHDQLKAATEKGEELKIVKIAVFNNN